MNHKDHFEFLKETLGENFKQKSEDVVRDLINILIRALFIPTKGERTTTSDRSRIEHFGIDFKEPINWGDLKCLDVQEFKDGTFIATVDEASPNQCPTLCNYIETYMASYGWIVRVETEW